MDIKPQKGFQEDFLSSPADIVIGGGSAGAGKTFALLVEPLRFYKIDGFNAIFFRRTFPQITAPGAIWDESMKIYPLLGGKPNESKYTYKFKSTKFAFSHLQYEKDVLNHQGSQYCYIAFDELTHFTKSQFFYMLSRNRSVCGVKPYIRATCNPDPESWVADLISWWIDPDTGFPVKERSGIIRWFIKDGDQIVWGNTAKEVKDKCPHLFTGNLKDTEPKSLTFIPGSIYDNQKLIKKDPGYLANLMSLGEEEKLRLLDGNWLVKQGEENLIDYVKLCDSLTNDFVKGGKRCITADIAFYGSDDFIVGVWDGRRLIDYVVMNKSGPKEVEEAIKSFASKYAVPRSNIVYDADGLGSYLDGYLKGAKGFKGNAVPIKQKGRKVEYKNLKAQCYYLCAENINKDEYYLPLRPEEEARIKREFKAIKRDKPDSDNKLRLIPKEKMKNILSGKSPDLMDMIMMREYLELSHTKVRITKT